MPEVTFEEAELFTSQTDKLTPPEGYRPYFSEMGLPRFGLKTVEWMRRDSQVKLGMGFHAAPLLKPKIELSGDPQIVDFVTKTIKKLWHRAVPKITDALWYTVSGGEVLYERDDATGYIMFKDYLPLYPSDLKILHAGSRKWGLQLNRVAVSANTDLTDAEKQKLVQGRILLEGPKSFLYVHKRQWGGWNGQSELEGAYVPWLEKTDKRGAHHSRRLWFYKNAFGGGIIFHPPGGTPIRGENGQTRFVSYRDIARQAMERFTNGGVWIFEATVDEKGNRNWEYQEPKMHGDGKGLIEYITTLDKEILNGMGIPDDVLQAVSGKDSLSGRTVPLQCFFISLSQTLMNIFDELKWQIIDFLVQVNFGPGAQHRYNVEKVEVDTDQLLPQQTPQQPGMPGQPGQDPNDPNNPNAQQQGQQGQGPIVIGRPDEPAEFSDWPTDPYGRKIPRLVDVSVFSDMSSHPRAPAGGAIIKGRMFKGGEFIYKGDIEGLSKPDLNRLAQVTGHGTAENLLSAVNGGPKYGPVQGKPEGQRDQADSGGKEGSGERRNAGNFSDVIGGRSGRSHAQTQEMYARTRSMIDDEDQNRPLAIAREYNPAYRPMKDNPTSKERQAPIGQHYEMVGDPRDPNYKETEFERGMLKEWNTVLGTKFKSYAELVDASYTALGAEVLHQYNRLVDEGIHFEWHSDGSGDYADSMEMASDVHHNKHMHVYQGGEKHSFLGEEDEDGLSLNDKFRAVHDYFGHAVSGTSFGPKGEENAWASHVQMFSPLARVAMSSETRGQNSWVNYSGVNDEANALFKKAAGFRKAFDQSGDPALKELADKTAAEGRSKFKFAKQKSVVLPYDDLREGFEGFVKEFGMSYFDASEHPRIPKGIKRGGLIIKGKEFTGGQFVYKSDLQGLTKPELDQLASVLGVTASQLQGGTADNYRKHLAAAKNQLKWHTSQKEKLKKQGMEVPKEMNRTISSLTGLASGINELLKQERQEALKRGLATFDEPLEPRSAVELLQNPLKINGTGKKGNATQFDISLAFGTHSRTKYGGVLEHNNPAHQEIMADTLAQEAKFAYNLDHNAKDWYKQKVSEARSFMSELHPELKEGSDSGDDHWGAFSALLAATSQGTDVTKNFEFAEKLYADWKGNEHGKFAKINKDLFSSNKTDAVHANLEIIETLANRYGLNGMRRLLTRDMVVGGQGRHLLELAQDGIQNLEDEKLTITGMNAALGRDTTTNPVAGEKSTEKLLGAMILGPKIGSFYGNLMGRYHTVTMDLWFMRTMGRVMGTLGTPNRETIKSNSRELLNAFNEDAVRYHGVSKKTLAGHIAKARKEHISTNTTEHLTPEHPVVQFAAKQYKKFKDGGFSEKSDVNRASAALLHVLNHPDAHEGRDKLNDKKFREIHLFGKDQLRGKGGTKSGADHVLSFLHSAVKHDHLEGHSLADLKSQLQEAAETGNIEAESTLSKYLSGRYRRYITGADYHTKEVFGVESSSRKPQYIDRSNVNKAVKNIALQLFSTQESEAPSSPERTSFRQVIDKVQTRLKKDGIELTNADLQAVLWYLEKDLYTVHGYTSPRGAATDYANAAEMLYAAKTKQHRIG